MSWPSSTSILSVGSGSDIKTTIVPTSVDYLYLNILSEKKQYIFYIKMSCECFVNSCLIDGICVCLCIVLTNTLCCVLLFFFVLCCQFLWIVHLLSPLLYSLTFIVFVGNINYTLSPSKHKLYIISQ